MKKFVWILVLLLALPAIVSGEEIVDDELGFQVRLPDEFVDLPIDESDSKTVYQFVEKEPTDEEPAIHIQIQKLGALISVGDRLSRSAIPKVDGQQTTMETIDWKEHTFDVMKHFKKTDSGESVSYVVQFPLAKEAIQVQVSGPKGKDQAVHSIFYRVVQRFRNTEPLHDSSADSGEQLQKIISWVTWGTLVVLVLLVVFRLIKSLLGSKSDPVSADVSEG